MKKGCINRVSANRVCVRRCAKRMCQQNISSSNNKKMCVHFIFFGTLSSAINDSIPIAVCVGNALRAILIRPVPDPPFVSLSSSSLIRTPTPNFFNATLSNMSPMPIESGGRVEWGDVERVCVEKRGVDRVCCDDRVCYYMVYLSNVCVLYIWILRVCYYMVYLSNVCVLYIWILRVCWQGVFI